MNLDTRAGHTSRADAPDGSGRAAVIAGFPTQDGNDVGLASVIAAARMTTADVAVITDSTGAILHVSASFCAMTAYEPSDMIGRNCRMLQGPGTDRKVTRHLSDVLSSGEAFHGELLNYRKDGAPFWTELSIVPLHVGGGPTVTHFVSVQSDISNRVAQLGKFQVQGFHDHATGLPNRTAAEQAVAEAVGMPTDDHTIIAVALIDLDDFRLAHNTLGHAAGDSLLKQWATRSKALLPTGDILARMGGDEFLLLLRSISRDNSTRDIQRILDRFHRAVEEPFVVGGREVRIGMSLGIALVPEDGVDRRSIISSADRALYAARNRPHRDPSWWRFAGADHCEHGNTRIGPSGLLI